MRGSGYNIGVSAVKLLKTDLQDHNAYLDTVIIANGNSLRVAMKTEGCCTGCKESETCFTITG